MELTPEQIEITRQFITTNLIKEGLIFMVAAVALILSFNHCINEWGKWVGNFTEFSNVKQNEVLIFIACATFFALITIIFINSLMSIWLAPDATIIRKAAQIF